MLGKRSTLCIDWDERSLRVLEATVSRGTVHIRKAVETQIPEGVNVRDPAALGEVLKRTLAEHRMRTRRAIVDVPRHDAYLALMPLPKSSFEDMSSMVHLQAAKELPFAKDQAVVDFAVARERENGMCEVWVGAVRTSVVDYYQQVIVRAGLKLDRIGLRPYANLASLPADAISDGRTLMVDIGPAMTEINVIEEGRLVYSRGASVSIPPGGPLAAIPPRPPREAEEAGEGTIPLHEDRVARTAPIDQLLIEVSRTIEAYRAASPGAVINRVILAGAAGLDRQVADRLESRFGVPASIYEPPEIIRWRGEGGASSVSFSAVIGLALSSAGEGDRFFDFLHPKEPEAAERVRRQRRPMAVITAVIFLAAGGVLAYHPIRQRTQEITRLQKMRDAKNVDRKDRQEILAQVGDVQEWEKENRIWIDTLHRLAEAFPDNQQAYIREASFTDKGNINIELVAKDRMIATGIVDRVSGLKDEKGRTLFTAKPGTNAESSVPEYPIKDEVLIELKSLTPVPAAASPTMPAPTTTRAGDEMTAKEDAIVKHATPASAPATHPAAGTATRPSRGTSTRPASTRRSGRR